MNKMMTAIMFVFLLFSTQSYAGPIWVEPYVKKDGTTINGHWRSDPNASAPLFSPWLYENRYGYEVWVYMKGNSVASLRGEQTSCGRSLTYYRFKKMPIAAEEALNDCSSFLYRMAFTAGFNSEEADKFVKIIFTKQNCRFIGFSKEIRLGTAYHIETMICNLDF